MIAMAIANDPDVIIADEPTTALDVTIQAQVLEVLKKAQQETGAAMIMITHDLGVVAGIADRVTVMYAGRPVEQGTVDEIFYRPADAVHDRAARRRPRLDAHGEAGARHAGGQPAVGGQPAARLPVRAALPDGRPTPAAPTSRRWPRPTIREHLAACIYSGRIAEEKLDLRRHLPGPAAARVAAGRAPRGTSARPCSAGRDAAALPADEGCDLPPPDRHRLRRRRHRPGHQGG